METNPASEKKKKRGKREERKKATQAYKPNSQEAKAGRYKFKGSLN